MRFVILEHDHPRGRHFDFMLEAGRVLKTWALSCTPQADIEIECTALPDHRLAYLKYEGEVSGGRGSVRRWDEGKYTVERRSDSEWVFTLTGKRVAGRVELRQLANDATRWGFLLRQDSKS